MQYVNIRNFIIVIAFILVIACGIYSLHFVISEDMNIQELEEDARLSQNVPENYVTYSDTKFVKLDEYSDKETCVTAFLFTDINYSNHIYSVYLNNEFKCGGAVPINQDSGIGTEIVSSRLNVVIKIPDASTHSDPQIIINGYLT